MNLTRLTRILSFLLVLLTPLISGVGARQAAVAEFRPDGGGFEHVCSDLDESDASDCEFETEQSSVASETKPDEASTISADLDLAARGYDYFHHLAMRLPAIGVLPSGGGRPPPRC